MKPPPGRPRYQLPDPELDQLSVDELFSRRAVYAQTDWERHHIENELARREYKTKLEFGERQTQAMVDTAKYSRRMVRWMFWSVAVLAVSSLVTCSFDLIPHLRPDQWDLGQPG
jgi:hypothetical protein